MRGVTCLLGLLHVSLAFNLEVRYPHVYHSDTPLDYFGFSVALHPGSGERGDGPWMMVGAPRSNDSNSPSVREPGQVMRCPLGRPCVPLGLQFTENNNNPPGQLDGSMLGAAQDILGGRFVTCAPRWKGTYFSDNYTMLGASYFGAAEEGGRNEKILPLDTPRLYTTTIKARGRNLTFPIYQYGEAGFSVHFPNISKGPKEMVLGAPGANNWRGTTILYKDSGDVNSGLARRKREIGLEAFLEGPIIPDTFTDGKITSFGLLGYAVTSGRFFALSQMIHVASSPRADLVGKVLLYTFPTKTQGTMTHMIEISGKQTGAYFGSSLTACNLNGDNLDDLVVGAPLYSDVQDEGRVYIYYGSHARKFDRIQNITGNKPNGRFGYAISCIGDIDRDGYHDLAISAPYEGNGVVYIHNGGPGGVSAQHSQRIEGSVVAPGSRGFGFSLSRGQDVDANGYDDIAVGAYKSGHAVLLRARPVVNFKLDLKPLLSGNLRRNSTILEVEACVRYFGLGLATQLEVVQRLELDPRLGRLHVTNQGGDTVHESRVKLLGQTTLPHNFNCRAISITVKNNINNFLEPLSLYLEYKLIPENNEYRPVNFQGGKIPVGQDVFKSNYPMMRPGDRAYANAEILFETDCGDDNVCIADLSVSLQFVDPQSVPISSFVVGSDNSLRVLLNVTNAGEHPAYLTRVEVFLPVRAASFPLQCKEVAVGNNSDAVTRLTCEVANPLPPGKMRSLEIVLDVKGMSATQKNFKLMANTNTISRDTRMEDNEAQAELQLIARADMTVLGKSVDELYYFGSENKEEKISRENNSFSIRYQVEKFGPSTVDKVLLAIAIPVELKSTGKRFLFLNGLPQFKHNSRETPLPCYSEYLLPEPPVSSDVEARRRKRDTDEELGRAGNVPANRTLYVNCSNSDSNWACVELRCPVGPFVDTNAMATLQLNMLLDVSVLEPLLGLRDIILFGTDIELTIIDPRNLEQPLEGNKPDRAVVSATFLGRLPAGRVETWVIVVSVIAGVLLLVALVVGLVKAGFFVRKDKEALTQLKQENGGMTNPAKVED